MVMEYIQLMLYFQLMEALLASPTPPSELTRSWQLGLRGS